MNSMETFIGLLVLAYLGSILMGDRSIRGYGLPSGSEYLLLGFLLGPAILGTFDTETLSLFTPILQVGIGWLALLVGLGWGVVGDGRARLPRVLGSFVLALLCGGLVMLAVFLVSAYVTPFDFKERLLLAGCAGAVGMETTRIAIRWVFERHGASGPLSRAIAVLADSDELPAFLLVAVLFVCVPMPEGQISLPSWAWFIATIGLGVALGLICVALIGDQLHRGEALSFLLGATLLGAGVAVQLGLASIVTLFVMGLTLSATSSHRQELRALLGKSEAPVLLPVLLLAGAQLKFDVAPFLPWLILTTLGARLLGKLLSGLGLLILPEARPAGPWLGLGLLPSGLITICIGLSLALRLQNTIGDIALVLAAATALFGEAIGPLSLRRALVRAQEITPQRESKPPSSKPEPSPADSSNTSSTESEPSP